MHRHTSRLRPQRSTIGCKSSACQTCQHFAKEVAPSSESYNTYVQRTVQFQGSSKGIISAPNHGRKGKGRAGRRCPATAKLCYLPTTQCSLSRRASRLELVHGGTPHQLAPPPPLPPPPLLLVLYPQHHGQQTSVREGYSMSRSTPALRLRLLSRITLSATPVSIDNDRA